MIPGMATPSPCSMVVPFLESSLPPRLLLTSLLFLFLLPSCYRALPSPTLSCRYSFPSLTVPPALAVPGLEKWSKEAEREWWGERTRQLAREVAHLLTPHRRVCRKRGVEAEVRIMRLAHRRVGSHDAQRVAQTLLSQAAELDAGLLVIGQSGDPAAGAASPESLHSHKSRRR